MITGIIGEDYTITLQPVDIGFLEEGQTLESMLFEDGMPSQKKVALRILNGDAHIENADGIDLKYFPEIRGGWKDIVKIQIGLLPHALEQIKRHNHFGTRYNGTDMISFIKK